ncbi:signal peptidase I [Sphingomonas qomolangmaensis]|uniref:Signal peptidase I n=1 Tax=Sphingomonas qomolangmaensis TaxID=2918765 RepID=A0ABY5L3Q0_9SPHN|nr:signal peptidase I [Sphingomonas qomolangmaensis]UUL81590.1 signal peptidase I [Sphingomonas qomolangmaensis]
MAAEDLALDPKSEPVAAPEKRSASGTDWWGEVKGIFWLILAVLGFHSLIAKPFYIPSESMMPGLLVGDRLVVTKYPYGYSFISPTFHLLPFISGRLFGSMPERGDVVIVSPPGSRTDYIKRVIGLPGDVLEVRGGTIFLNDVAVERQAAGHRLIPVDANTRCEAMHYPDALVSGEDGAHYCRVAIFRETLPNGASYDTIDMGYTRGDNFAPVEIPDGHVFLMGDNRDNSADSRFGVEENGLGGPVPWENIGGRAEFVTFSLDGSATLNPLTWWQSLRPSRTGASLHPDRADAE